MRRILAAFFTASAVLAGASLGAPVRAETNLAPVRSWTEVHARYDHIVDRVAAAQKPPSAIGGGPTGAMMEEEILRIYRTPSPHDGFWSDFRDRFDRAVEATQRLSPRAAP